MHGSEYCKQLLLWVLWRHWIMHLCQIYMKPLQVIEIYIAHNITHALVDPRDRKDVVCWEHLVRFYIALLGVKSAGLLQRREISPSSSFRRAISGALGVNILPGSSYIFSALCRPCAQVPRYLVVDVWRYDLGASSSPAISCRRALASFLLKPIPQTSRAGAQEL